MTATARRCNPAEIAGQYLQVWNENDAIRRRTLIEQIFTQHASYIDPLMQSAGHDGIDAMIAGAQSQFSGFRFNVSGKPDAHHDFVRFSWSVGAENSEPLICGTDIAVIAPDGRIEAITGFIDKMPA